MYSSLLTPFFLGLVAGGMMSGYIDPDAQTFFAAYLKPWVNLFSISVGLFATSICAFLAAVYLTGETKDSISRNSFYKKSRLFNSSTVVSGGLVFLAAEFEGLDLIQSLLFEPITLLAFVLASVSLIFLWRALRKGLANQSRLIAGFQVVMILFAVGYHYFPDFVAIKDGQNLSFYNAAATEKTLAALGWALLIGSVLILPSLYYLMVSFQKSDDRIAS